MGRRETYTTKRDLSTLLLPAPNNVDNIGTETSKQRFSVSKWGMFDGQTSVGVFAHFVQGLGVATRWIPHVYLDLDGVNKVLFNELRVLHDFPTNMIHHDSSSTSTLGYSITASTEVKYL